MTKTNRVPFPPRSKTSNLAKWLTLAAMSVVGMFWASQVLMMAVVVVSLLTLALPLALVLSLGWQLLKSWAMFPRNPRARARWWVRIRS